MAAAKKPVPKKGKRPPFMAKGKGKGKQPMAKGKGKGNPFGNKRSPGGY